MNTTPLILTLRGWRRTGEDAYEHDAWPLQQFCEEAALVYDSILWHEQRRGAQA